MRCIALRSPRRLACLSPREIEMVTSPRIRCDDSRLRSGEKGSETTHRRLTLAVRLIQAVVARVAIPSLPPDQEHADVAGHAAGKVEHLGGKTESMRLHIALPSEIKLRGLATQRRWPTRLG